MRSQVLHQEQMNRDYYLAVKVQSHFSLCAVRHDLNENRGICNICGEPIFDIIMYLSDRGSLML